MRNKLVREDDYEKRRKEVSNLSDEDLYNRFWELAEEIVIPMVEIAKKHTSPSIERSVLLRMGFSSLEVKELVNLSIERNLIGHGVGHLVYRVSRDKSLGIREAGALMIKGEYWDYLEEIFKEVNNEAR